MVGNIVMNIQYRFIERIRIIIADRKQNEFLLF